jgi:hypothetical protein
MDSHGFCLAGWKAGTRRRTPKISNSILILAIVVAGLPLSEAASQQTRSNLRSLPAITSRAEFDSLARIYSHKSYPLPHLLFVIDRKEKNKVYYVNSTRYPFHKDFVNGTYLSLERGQEFFENNYLKPNRRFILGTVAYQTPLKRWTFEFWEGDLIPADQIKTTSEIINQSFFQPVAFKPNSLRQEEASAGVEGLARILQSDIASEQAYEPLNLASGIGRIHIIEKLDEHVEIGSNEILVLNEVPIQLPPVAGIIIAQPSTPLSHINLLVKGWGVPNAYIKNAHQLLKEFDGWWVSFETRRDTYVIKRADLGQVKEYQQRMASRPDLIKPRSDLTVTRIALLNQQRARDVTAYGGKSANLGEMIRARLPGIIVPSGFTVPFFYYDQFISDNNLDESIHEMMNDQKFVHDPTFRRRRLADLRERIQNGALNDQLRADVLRLVHTQFSGKGLFARSSSNSEDLPNFSGAGIHSSVPNVKGDHQLMEAIKTVWASLWNFEAYEARERAGIDHGQVYMAVLIQEGINADSAGVMLTTDPYDRENKSAYYISAKRGLGIKVVEGKRVAEQIIFRPQTNTIQVLTRSAEDSLLTFDEKGGVKEVPISGERAVLTDEMIRKLVKAAQDIKRVFGGKDQDIEWIYVGGQIYIVQARPFVA